MGKTITELQPTQVWEIFDKIAAIPRPSKHEEQIRDFVQSFGEKLGLETLRDDVGNVIIRKPATPGMENRIGVVLQGHLDMVPQKNSDKAHDFITDPIEPLVDGDWVKANGTTLGADNGIGVAAILAVMAATDLEHGPLEALLTATEETGMDGAKGLQPDVLKGKILINTDSEDEGELYVGCAGGEDVTAKFKYKEDKLPKGYKGFSLRVTGMKGGHSGIDISLGRGNAIKVFFRILNAIAKHCGARLAWVEGGSLRNAIPREAFGVIAVPKEYVAELTCIVSELESIVRGELEATEPDLKVSLEGSELPKHFMDRKHQKKLTVAVLACPNGVIRMSDSMPGLVETSTNLAIVKSDTDKQSVTAACLLRSSVDTAKDELAERLEALFSLAGAKVKRSGAYSGWKPNMNSPILKTMQSVYEQNFGKIPEVKAIHAGLECGILSGAYPDWDMISFGPTIRYPHSPDEKVNIESVQKFWNFLVETLRNIPEEQ